MEPMTVRSADPADLPRIAAIYDDQVRTAISTFDRDSPGLGYWEARLASEEPGDHVLVADSPAGEVVGYAYSCSAGCAPTVCTRRWR
jgi:phosphinothricin acetyltransferase